MSQAIRESAEQWTRRRLLQAAGALAVGTTLPNIASAQQQNNSVQPNNSAQPNNAPAKPQASPGSVLAKKAAPFMQIGIFLDPFPRKTLEARLDAVKVCGLDCVQFNMNCVGLATVPEAIAPELIARIRREADARQIEIASVQGTFNMCHPDAEYRRLGLRGIGVLSAACQPLGTSKIHICTGTRNRGNMWGRHPDNNSPAAWTDMADCIRAAVDIAKPFGVTLAFEPEVNNVVDSGKKARRLLDEIGSPQLQVTMDAANLFHAGELPQMSEVLDEAFALVGKNVVMAHAKDLSHDGDAGHEPAGHGKLDYDRYLSLLHAYGFKGPLLLHGLSEAQVPGCLGFLRDKLARVAAAAAKSDPAPK